MKYLSLEERKYIAKMYNLEKAGYREISRVLKRSHSTIMEEIKRNVSHHTLKYDAEKAHYGFLKRQNNKGKRGILERKEALKKDIINKIIEDQWSPEEIAGKYKEEYGICLISHETIYKYVYSEEGRKLKLWQYLRHNRGPKRRQKGRRKSKRSIISDRTPVHCRWGKQFGDLETDSMIFSKQRTIISVQVEVISKRCIITKLPNKTAMETHEALRKSIVMFGENIVRSITFDNGTENMLHTILKKDFQIETYFCDPYSSWQKGLVENTNKLIRQYLPRYTNMDEISDEDIFIIQEKLNNRPRKSLNYKTPNQVFIELSQSGRI